MLHQLKNRNLYVMVVLDVVAFCASLLLAYATRFSFALSGRIWGDIARVLPLVIAVKSVVFFLFGTYRGLWRYTSFADAWRLFKASTLSSVIIVVGLTFFNRFSGYPRFVFLADSMFTCFLCGGIRAAIRLHYRSTRLAAFDRGGLPPHRQVRALIVGAGDAAEKIIREVQDDAGSRYEIAACLDDDHSKQGSALHGVPIRGPIHRMAHYVSRFQVTEVLIAAPSMSGERVLSVVELCKQCGVACRTLPALSCIVDGRVSVKDVREVAVEDLLGRDLVTGDSVPIRASLEGACVMVTGAGGSIGSEIARQVARCNPRRLVLFEVGESPLFEIHRELHDAYPNLDLVPVIGDIRLQDVVNRAFDAHRPQFVYHAAAYKHVPLMEAHPEEAVLNNVRGTRHLAEAARRVKTRRFVMISSDKAVRPGNVMGATKRLCELLVEAMNGDGTEFLAVRFGNVLGSNGSVIPIFKKQIAAGGPITITHADATRFFMTIPEAVHLVLRCGAMRDRLGVFVLEMGTPVRIMDLARNVIRLSGLREGVDIAITVTGLRPGERLHEELVSYGEGLEPTGVAKINVLKRTVLPIAQTVVLALLRRLELVAQTQHPDATRTMLMQIIALDQDVHERAGHGASDAVLHEIQERWANAIDSHSPAVGPQSRTRRLFLIDDQRFMRNALERALARQGYGVELADTQKVAIERLREAGAAFDIILCDFFLPDGTGMDILAEYRRLALKAPFILMTAYDSPQLDEILGTESAPPLLFKPFRIEDLLAIIEAETGHAMGRDVPIEDRGLDSEALADPVPEHLSSGRSPLTNPGLEGGALVAGSSVGGDGSRDKLDSDLRVLVVDGLPATGDRISAALKHIRGVRIEGQAATVSEAMEALRLLKPDVVILDLKLSDGNGLSLLRVIQREHLSTRAIVLTNYPYPQYDRRARAAGAVDFLAKASGFGKLVQHIEDLVATRQRVGPRE